MRRRASGACLDRWSRDRRLSGILRARWIRRGLWTVPELWKRMDAWNAHLQQVEVLLGGPFTG
jgi:hypothetical protein